MSETNPFPKFRDGAGKPITRENFQANAWDLGHAVGKVEGRKETIEKIESEVKAHLHCEKLDDLASETEIAVVGWILEKLEALRKEGGG